MDYTKKRLVLVYYGDIVDGHFILWVYYITSVVIHYNPWRTCFLPVNVKFSGLFSWVWCGGRSINIKYFISNGIIVGKICKAWIFKINLLLTWMWNTNLSTNRRKLVIDWRFCSNNLDIIFFNRWSFTCLITLIVKVGWIVFAVLFVVVVVGHP